MPINAGYEYLNAEKTYLAAQTPEQRITALEDMIRTAPKHKGSENLLAGLKLRLKKFKEKQEKVKKTGKGKAGLKKEGFQVVLVGMPNSGKSALLNVLTNAKSFVNEHPFTTYAPVVGTMDYDGVKAQIVDIPSIGSASFDIGLVNTADCILEVVDKFEDISKIESMFSRVYGKKIIVYTKVDLLDSGERRKLEEKCKSKRISVVFCSFKGEGIEEVKKRIFLAMGSIRIYTKEPGKQPSRVPVVLAIGSSVFDVAESIRKGFAGTVSEARVTGPSAAFVNQRVGMKHILKDKDVVEFKTR
ncbi:MAG: GTPase [Nanoarchaeota archaeon]